MTLATRCPNCTTVFKVVQDQLRVSEGWVRCGRCAEVFNAAKHLVDPGTGEVRRASMAVRSAFPEPAAPPAAAEDHGGASQGDGDDGAGMTGAGVGRVDSEDRAAVAQASGRTNIDLGDVDPGDVDPGEGTEAENPASAPPSAAAGAAPAPAAPVGQVGPEASTIERAAASAASSGDALRPPAAIVARPAPVSADALPSFVRSARRAERWRHPAVRVLLVLGVVLGVVLLAAQWLYVERDQAAARWPALRPLLTQACSALGCRVEAARAIDALTVESSGLVRVEKTDLYRLAVTLRNQREFEVALPAIELALTDAQGRLLARRVLRASELGATVPTLAATSELAMQATIQVASEPVAGYTIELFYP